MKRLALKIDETVRRVRPNAFRGNQAKENVIKAALLPLLGNDRAEVERIFLIIKAKKNTDADAGFNWATSPWTSFERTSRTSI